MLSKRISGGQAGIISGLKRKQTMNLCELEIELSKLTPVEQEIYTKFIGDEIELRKNGLQSNRSGESSHQTFAEKDITNCNGIRPEVQ